MCLKFEKKERLFGNNAFRDLIKTSNILKPNATMLEKIEPSEQEIGEAIALICKQNGLTTEQLKPYYTAEFEKAVIRSVLTSKVMRLVRDAADIAVV